MVIWKTVIHLRDVQQIDIPNDAEILCAREQFEQICIWYRCNPVAPTSPRIIAIVGTGNPAPLDDAKYLGTAFLRGGQLIFHVFEKI